MKIRALLAVLAVAVLAACTSPTAPAAPTTQAGTSAAYGSGLIGTNL